MLEQTTPSLDQKERSLQMSLIEYVYWLLAGLCVLVCTLLFFLWFGSNGGVLGFMLGGIIPGLCFYPKHLYKQMISLRIDRRQMFEHASIKYEPARNYGSERIPYPGVSPDEENPLDRGYYPQMSVQ